MLALIIAFAALNTTPAYAEEVGDPYDGEEVYQVCAPCHGAEGEGGGGGNYPRLAGMNFDYLAKQLEAFQRRERTNIPMFPFTEERELSRQDILDVSTYISAIKLSNRMPEMADSTDGYALLLAASRVLQIPREKGNLENGKKHYDEACAFCHGEKGEGEDSEPLLAGQHIKYLRHQFDEMSNKNRFHPLQDTLIEPLSHDDINDILAYISTLDD
ncbi:c-type cytochrome [Pseudomonadota bacterium]